MPEVPADIMKRKRMIKMRILVVNDDGIKSAGISSLARMAAAFGEVWVVAPDNQCSAMSQRVTAFGSITVKPEADFPVEGVHAFSVSGTPADCVKAALQQIMPFAPDVVFSGINNGYNVGVDILYSGTVGAAMEALTNGIPAIAFSAESAKDLRAAEKFLPEITRDLMEWEISFYEIWNVNVPSCSPEEIRGVSYDRTPSCHHFYHLIYEPAERPEGGMELKIGGNCCQEAESGSDIYAVLGKYISVGKIENAVLKYRRG